MEYPLQIELDVTQDDFIEVEILEQELEAQLWKQSVKKTFIVETAVIAVVIALVLWLASKGTIMAMTVIFPIFFWFCFLLHFVYTYNWGVKREFNMAVQHLLHNKDTQEFFTPERGMVLFYEDRCEYLTNEQRRFFDYDLIKNIKIIKHLYIFVMKRSKEKNLRGFAYMVIPRRNLTDNQKQQMDEICARIVKENDLKEWVKSEIFG
ncbi:MAG: hypothetical protein IJN77_02010 [Oscillospiraceae bacterium]|nr:hypothetical protein [Oscillospiraceae bacterium]MBQ6849794.1 hypothetical protein [Oscillospiraceae bacterium]